MTDQPPERGTLLHTQVEHLTPVDLAECASVTGEPSDRPFGVGCVLALRALCDWGGLPDAAIMRSYRARWLTDVSPGAFTTRLSVGSVEQPRTRYVGVSLRYETFSDDVLVVSQQQDVLWPLS